MSYSDFVREVNQTREVSVGEARQCYHATFEISGTYGVSTVGNSMLEAQEKAIGYYNKDTEYLDKLMRGDFKSSLRYDNLFHNEAEVSGNIEFDFYSGLSEEEAKADARRLVKFVLTDNMKLTLSLTNIAAINEMQAEFPYEEESEISLLAAISEQDIPSQPAEPVAVTQDRYDKAIDELGEIPEKNKKGNDYIYGL